MSAARTAGRLIRFYPPAWRARYGDELEALILDMSEGSDVPWRVRADVATAGGRERFRAAGLGSDDTPEGRARSGAVLVLWAWALFVLAGAVVQKTSEHWQAGTPASSRALASAAFGSLVGVAILAGLLVLAGITSAIPGLVAVLRDGGWPRLSRRVLAAALATIVLLLASAGLVAWAHGLTAYQRDGHDDVYAIGFLAWAGLGAGCLLLWTAAAAQAAHGVDLRPPSLRGQTRLALAVAAAMGVMTVATATWWAAVAHTSPAALTGGPPGAQASALVPQLMAAMALMLLGTALGVVGARRAAGALRELPTL